MNFLFGEKTCFVVHGYPSCPYYQKAQKLGQAIEKKNSRIQVDYIEVDREEWKDYIEKERMELKEHRAHYHYTCPLVVEGCDDEAKLFVGGYAEFLAQSRKRKLV
ncbi:hypothetical protein CYY_002438 [Polysphondylium violaceum]|uniref:Glutaredoxin domain-containing protein n=1 Tax=Polysphondylium violaceum TaxID=133409 RepID=A0A8J4V0U1_9MYCE|nr:hypothetical protein CYY_002438 [Polysphondylium violaceum]